MKISGITIVAHTAREMWVRDVYIGKIFFLIIWLNKKYNVNKMDLIRLN